MILDTPNKNARIMRTILFALISVVFLGTMSFGQQVGNTTAGQSTYTFNFYEGTFDQALKDAAKRKKVIFVDAYTTWCGPCKMLNNSTFKDVKAGEFFNENFINIKIDMEKGEGPAFAMKYSVRAYPTLLFINSKGEVVHKTLGYKDADMLTEEGKIALAKGK
jgi:thiol:disulfide interchange protein